ncbi:MAG: peptidase C1 [Candidatus Marinimicrobia bacterium]|nr:peptidase C1 [Candidatus Neomarinimicrobiota bacterium]
MKKVLTVLVVILMVSTLFGQTDKVKYIKRYYDPVLKEMREQADHEKAIEDSITVEIRKRQKERKDKEREEKKSLRFEFKGIKKPKSPDVFEKAFHFPPVPQYRTGTCWCFCTTSFIESEIYRLTEEKIKLSEMHTVYYEYIEKVRRYVNERGDSEFGQGSESNAVFRIIKEHGMVPIDVYPGLINNDKHEHSHMFDEINNYLKYINEHNYWDENEIISTVKIILNKYLGVPPESFKYKGKKTTPLNFMNKVLKINLDDYIDVMSTSSIPFYTKGEFKVPDNWWHDENYYNVPLDVWYKIIKDAVKRGYTVAIGGDVSEPGYNGFEDAAFVPDFDIPQQYINQDSREFRFYNHSTADDHGIHIVGYITIGKGNKKRDWFLIKDSARSSRHGKYKGYYFYRDDYIKLKMLTFTVHKDMMKKILKKFG